MTILYIVTHIHRSIIMNERMFLFTFILRFCLRFFFLKAPKINDADRKVVTGVQKSLCNAHNY